ncbi:MAG: hypothetical protein ABIJ09_21160 [Pseudomonadota bacterium]
MTSKKHSTVRALGCLLALGMFACGPQSSLIIVEVDAGLSIPDQVNALALEVSDTRTLVAITQVVIRLDPGQDFPLRISLEPGEDTPPDLTIVVSALLDGADIARATGQVSWTDDHETVVTLPPLVP